MLRKDRALLSALDLPFGPRPDRPQQKDIDVTVTRSGRSYPKRTVQTMTGTSTSRDTSAVTVLATVHILQDDTKSPKFIGEDTGPDVHTFLHF